MKFRAFVHVKLRPSVSDAAGNAVRRNTKKLAPNLDISKLRLGKGIDLEFEAPDRETAEKELYTLSDRLLSNVVIEDWSYELNEIS